MIQLTQSRVVFNEQDHTYFLDGKQLQGVTSTLIKRAFPNKYADVPESVLAHAAERGHDVHKQIEMLDKNGDTPTCTEAINYSFLKGGHGLKTVANEYLVSDEKHYASSIDVVFVNTDGEICLADIKTTYKFDNASVALQLSIYKRFFEEQNAGLLHVRHLYGIWLRDDNSELIEVSPVDDETLDNLIQADIEDKPFDFNPLPDWYADLEAEYSEQLAIRDNADKELNKIKEKVMSMMQFNKVSQIKSGNFTVSYIPERMSKRFDSATFKKENADLYDSYMKESKTAAQVRFLQTKNKGE